MNYPSHNNTALYTWLFNKGVELLARREHSRAELQNKIKQKLLNNKQWQNQDAASLDLEINKALAKLEEYGYLNDERFAQAYAASRLNKGYGNNRIKQELKHKGISDDVIEPLLNKDHALDIEIENTGVYCAWARKFKTLTSDPKIRAKQQRFLMYRGFSHNEINTLFEYLKHNHQT